MSAGHAPQPRLVVPDGKKRSAEEIALAVMEQAMPMLVAPGGQTKVGIMIVIDPAGPAAFRHNMDPVAVSKLPEVLREIARRIEASR